MAGNAVRLEAAIVERRAYRKVRCACARSSQYTHRPILPDQSRSVYRSSAAPAVLQRAPLRTFHGDLDGLPEGAQLIGTETRPASGSLEAVYGGGFLATRLRAMDLITILNRCYRFRGFVYSTPTSAPTKKASKWPYDRARVRPQSARVAIWRRPVTTNSPNGALSSSPCGGFSSSFCIVCGASTVAAVVLAPSKESPGATANEHYQSSNALPSRLGAAVGVARPCGPASSA
jgi:hypothetical protein